MRGNVPSKKKPSYPISDGLFRYLKKHNRLTQLPLRYDDLVRYSSSIPLLDQEGKDTLWETVFFQPSDQREVFRALTYTYVLLKADGDTKILDQLTVARIDYCTFGNSKPFRIRIINRLNDNYDHFYVKRADASRVYGLELEDLLSPNSVMYLVDDDTLIEEHIIGIPGDDFMRKNLDDTTFNQIRLSKEFIKFNERCFIRLLGDMRSYNFVVAVTPDIEGSQFRLRAIDFDQQSYEGRKSFYLPQYFKENNPIIFLGIQHMTPETVYQYQLEERSLIAGRIKASQVKVNSLLNAMVQDNLSTPDKVERLKKELAYHHRNNDFLSCRTMGEIVVTNIKLLLKKDFKASILMEKE